MVVGHCGSGPYRLKRSCRISKPLLHTQLQKSASVKPARLLLNIMKVKGDELIRICESIEFLKNEYIATDFCRTL